MENGIHRSQIRGRGSVSGSKTLCFVDTDSDTDPDADGYISNTYGSITAPLSLGSGGAGNGSLGGGAVRLTVARATINNGVISANGGWTQYSRGAAGSVYLSTGTLSGEGVIRANGAAHTEGPEGANASGGGGRVAVILTNSAANFSGYALGNITAAGGNAAGSSWMGGAGTVYLQSGSQSSNEGALVVNNATINSTRLCVISNLVRDTQVGDVAIRNYGRLHIEAGNTLTVGGNWTNASVFTSATQGTVELTGTSAATVWGSNTWGNLTIATAGKSVSFEAGRTQTVSGTPVFGNLVTLQSTEPGTRWMLTRPGTPVIETQPVGKVRVRDSDASGGKTFVTAGGYDLGNNLNWQWPPRGTVILLR